jgi:hypothetical protein
VQVCLSGYCIYFAHILQAFYLVLDSCVFVSVLDVCCKCFIWML